jgi:hypothetical protein
MQLLITSWILSGRYRAMNRQAEKEAQINNELIKVSRTK